MCVLQVANCNKVTNFVSEFFIENAEIMENSPREMMISIENHFAFQVPVHRVEGHAGDCILFTEKMTHGAANCNINAKTFWDFRSKMQR